jgi:AcrR family transcriptional regulator
MDSRSAGRRSDAERNRRRILEAAQRAFAESGLDTSLEDVARLAGVGIGTLYRHFPTRDDLILGCFSERLAAHVQVAEQALQAPDGWTGFSEYVERTCELQAEDRGLMDLLPRTFPTGHTFEGDRARAYELILQIIERAKAEGSLRADAVPEDYPMLLMGNAGVVERLGGPAPGAWRRYVAIMLEGLHERPERGELPPPPTPHQMLRATVRRARPSPRTEQEEIRGEG